MGIRHRNKFEMKGLKGERREWMNVAASSIALGRLVPERHDLVREARLGLA